MKRLLGLLLVVGMVGCGETVDAAKLVERGGLMYEGDSETPLTGVVVSKHDNGQKAREATYNDGKLVSETKWDEEGNETKK